MTTIEDTLTYADGSLASGRLVVYWEGFTVANVQAAGGMLDYEIVDGRVSVTLYANAGAQPTGSYYNAKYELENGKVYVEQWIVPNLPMVNLGQVRVSFPPTPSVMISPTQLTSLNATPGQFLQWDGVRWVPTYISTLNVQPNTINLVVDGTGSDVTVDGSPVALGSTMTLHMPDAGPTARGVVNSGDQTFAGNKTFQGMTTLTNVTVTGTVTLPPGSYVPVTRRILGDATIAGGGDLSADRTLSVVPDTSLQRVSAVNNQNVPLATRPQLYFDGGVNFNIAVTDNVAGNRIDIAIGPAGGATGLVISVFGRSGVVTAQTGDYTAAQVTNAVSVLGSYANPVWITSLAWSKITGAPAIGVSSVFGRAGAVVAVSGDYSAAQVTNAVDQSVSYANPVWITSLAWSKITGAPATVPPTRLINTSTGLTGGGDLSADRTLSVVPDTTVQRVQAALAGTVVGTRPQFNFIAGAGQTINVVDNAAANRIDITINTSGSGPATPSIYSVNGTVIGTRAQLNLISGSNVTLAGVDNSGANRVDITITATGAVASVFGRSGAVVAVAGDYTAAQVTNAVDSTGSYTNPVWIASLAWSKVTGAPAFLTDPLTTKGDLLTRGTSTTRLPVGANGQVLTADSTQTLGVKWGPAGGAASQTPWASDIDGAGFYLRNAGGIGVGNTATVLPDSSTSDIRLIIGTTTANATIAAQLSLINNRTDIGGLIGSLNFANYNITATEKRIAAINVGTEAVKDSGMMIFYTWNGGVVGERMRITAAGNVGIGGVNTTFTAAGYVQLTVGPQTPPQCGVIAACGNLTSLGAAVGYFMFSNFALAGADKRIGQIMCVTDTSLDSGALVFSNTNAGVLSERMRITAAGNVGIGTTNPQAVLETSRPHDTGYGLRLSVTGIGGIDQASSMDFYDVTGGNQMAKIQAVSEAAWGANLQFWTKPQTGTPGITQERMRITAAGRVGVGTASPNGALEVSGSVPAGRLNVTFSNTAGSAVGNCIRLRLGPSNGFVGSDLQPYIESFNEDAAQSSGLGFGTYSYGLVERMRITAVGNVGIGTATPQVRLSATGTSGAYNGSGIEGIAQLTTGTGGPADEKLQFGIVDGSYAWIQAVKPGTTTRPLLLNPGGGNVGIGTTGPPVRLEVISNDNSDTGGCLQLTANNLTTNAKYSFAGITSAYYYRIQANGGPLSLQPTGGNIGIGSTVTPNSKLAIDAGGVSYGQFRIMNGNYGAILYNDAASLYFLMTDAGNSNGAFNGYRPLYINLANGLVTMGNGVSIGGGLTVTGNCNITGQYQVNGAPFGGGITTQNLVGGSRSLNVAYQNATGKPMFVSVAYQAIAQGAGLTMKADAANPPNTIQAIISQAGNSGPLTVACWVLPGHYYSVSAGGSFTTQYTWTEWY
jgi:hypothetical protein